MGTLRITDECVFLEAGDREVLLVWHAGRTRWNGDHATITVENPPDGPVVTVADGDRVRVTGGFGHRDSLEDTDSFREWMLSSDMFDWVSAPAPACRTDTFGVVGNLEKAPAS